MQCEQTIDLSRPIRSERVRAFQPPWRTVYVYRCAACGAERRVYANSFRGNRAEPGTGAIRCGATLDEGGDGFAPEHDGAHCSCHECAAILAAERAS